MAGGENFEIFPGLVIPPGEIWYEFRHSSGPGGQNVNKVATAVALCFHVDGSGVLSEGRKALLRTRLAGRINADGVLRVLCEEGRSQSGNRVLAGLRFVELLRGALRPVKRRRATRPTHSSVERRLWEKRLLSARKSERRKSGEE